MVERMNVWTNKTIGEGVEGCQGRCHRGGDGCTRPSELTLSGWQEREGHWMPTAGHVQREAGNGHDQSSVTGVLDLPEVITSL